MSVAALGVPCTPLWAVAGTSEVEARRRWLRRDGEGLPARGHGRDRDRGGGGGKRACRSSVDEIIILYTSLIFTGS